MKHFTISWLFPTAAIGCSGQSAKETASTVKKKTVEVGKGTLSGVAEGIDEGRKAAESTDGALLVTNLEELNERLKVDVHSVDTSGPEVKVELVFTNTNERPVRVTNLAHKSALLLLDKEGFASEATGNISDITVPERAKIKQSFSFKKSSAAAPAILRIWGQEFGVPETSSP